MGPNKSDQFIINDEAEPVKSLEVVYEDLTKMTEELEDLDIIHGIDLLVKRCYEDSKAAGWHQGKTNIAEKIALIHSEISEALEGDRKDLYDDKLPEYKQIVVELGDAIIRICDLVGYLSEKFDHSVEYDMAAAIINKLYYNRSRADHKLENRMAEGGKKY